MKKNIRLIISIIGISLITNFTPVANLPSVNAVVMAEAKSSNKPLENPFPLILDSKTVDFMSYIPELEVDSEVKNTLKITRPAMKLEAASAILFNSDGIVLHYKNALKPVFPGSTSKLLTALVSLDWVEMDDRIKVGREIEMVPKDSSVAGLKTGEKLDVATLLNAMLLPSGNDAAYVMAVHVGRKSLGKPNAKCESAVTEFVRLMNEKAQLLGAKNSCFVTPDGYDALGQYTTAYDLGLIALEAAKNKKITKITKKTSVKAVLISGERFTWNNTNLLLNKNSQWYNANAFGLKTGSTTMAGKCLISAAKSENGMVVSVVMNSTSNGRWSDSNKLLNYGIQALKITE